MGYAWESAPIGAMPPPLTPSSYGNIPLGTFPWEFAPIEVSKPSPPGVVTLAYGKPRREPPPVKRKVIPTALGRTAFKPRAKLSLAHAKGTRELPRGSRIAGMKGVTKIKLENLICTDAERLAILFFCENNIPFDFETTLLGGRPELSFAEVPFLLAERLALSSHQAMRFYEQANGKTELESGLLSRSGFEVIDISTVRLLNNANEVLMRVLEFI